MKAGDCIGWRASMQKEDVRWVWALIVLFSALSVRLAWALWVMKWL